MSAVDTLRENFAVWHGELSDIHDLALCQARAMAPLLAEHEQDGSIGALRLAALRALATEDKPSALLAVQGVAERLAFCEALLSARPTLEEELLLTSAEEPPSHPKEGVPLVATLRSTVAAEARTRLQGVLGHTEAVYCNSFTELCEALARESTDFALLPLEDTAEGLLRRSYDLIERYELHIACTTEVSTPDGGLSRIALLYRTAPPALPENGCDSLLECRTTATEGEALTELLTVASACALTLRRIDTHATEDGEGMYRHLIFSASERERLFAAYLALFMPRTVITAKYLHL